MTEHDKERFRKWYAENKQKLSERRKKHYREDPIHRHKIVDRQRAYRERIKGGKGPGKDRYVLETVPGVKITVYSVGYVAAKLGRDTNDIRKWERQGYILAAWKEDPRAYTRNQIKLMATLSKFLTENRWNKSQKFRAKRDALVATIHSRWFD